MKTLIVLALTLSSSAALAGGKIHKGQPVTNADPVAKNIVWLLSPDGKPYCTGTIYSSNMIVTAGHCLGVPGGYIAFMDPSTGQGVGRLNLKELSDPRFNDDRDANGSFLNMRYDFGAIVFEGGLPPGFEPARRGGVCDVGLTTDQMSTTYGYGGTVMEDDTAQGLNKATQIFKGIERDLLKFSPGNGEVCPGDSGGPVFITGMDGKPCWIGTNSYIRTRQTSPPTGPGAGHHELPVGCGHTQFASSLRFVGSQRDPGGTNIFERWQRMADTFSRLPAPPPPLVQELNTTPQTVN